MLIGDIPVPIASRFPFGRYVLQNVSHGFLCRNGRFTTVDVPGAIFSACTEIDPQGDTLGRHESADGAFMAFC